MSGPNELLDFSDARWYVVARGNGEVDAHGTIDKSDMADEMRYVAGKIDGRGTDADHVGDLELWGAFDYELLLLAERYGLTADDRRSPLDVVNDLLLMAYANGFRDGNGDVTGDPVLRKFPTEGGPNAS